MKSVLVIEDEELLRCLLRDIFSEAGFAVYEARNGDEGLKLAAIFGFDIILSDIEMPVKNGIEFLKEFRRADRLTPVVMMSGGYTATENELFELGADMFIRKPFLDIQYLLQAVIVA